MTIREAVIAAIDSLQNSDAKRIDYTTSLAAISGYRMANGDYRIDIKFKEKGDTITNESSPIQH